MIRRITVLIILLTICSVCSALALPQEIAGYKVFKIWNFDKSADGWKPDHNTGKFTLANSVLSFSNTGADPWIINNTPGGLDASKYRYIGIKMRTSAKGTQNQVYFATTKAPIGASGVALSPIISDGKYHFYEIDMSQVPAWKGKVTALRIDCVNGMEEANAKVDIDWIAAYQMPARLSVGRPYTGIKDGNSFLTLPLQNTGGEPTSAGAIISANGTRQKLSALAPGKSRTFTFAISSAAKEIPIKVTLKDKLLLDVVLVSPVRAESPAATVQNADTALKLYNNCSVFYPTTMAIEGGRVLGAVEGVLRPLATLAYYDSNKVLHYLEINADKISLNGANTAVMQSTRQISGGTATFTWTFALPQDAREGTMTCGLKCTKPLDVVRFEGPRLLVGDGTSGKIKTSAIFPGLEYLGELDKSNDGDFTGPKFADKHIPNPYKVTVPVMAVQLNGRIIGLSWDPLKEWAPGQKLVSAEFEVPNRSQGAESHLMSLFAPSVPDYVNENSELARIPYKLMPDQAMTLSAGFFVRTGKIVDAIPNYYAAHGVPQAPAIAHGLDGTIDLCFKAYTQSLYSPEKNAWKSHIGINDSVVFRPNFAALILGESLRKNDPELAKKCKIDPNAQLTQYMGTTLDWFSEGAKKRIDGFVSQQTPGGDFPYSLDAAMIAKIKAWQPESGCDKADLGTVGETCPGIIARPLSEILAYGLKTGKKDYIIAGLKGLSVLNSFSVPRGAQTWEVHMNAPDIYAAGLAVDCNVTAYQITGDQKFLNSARYWAYTGLPFIYSWIPPMKPDLAAVIHKDGQGEGDKAIYDNPTLFYENTQRSINPGATIPVFGTSFYTVSWFGMPVQWCGMGWACPVLNYLKYRQDPLLKSVADMVFASCTQQQVEKGFLAGTYPDSWNLTENIAQNAYLPPDFVTLYAYALKGEKIPYSIENFGFTIGGNRSFLGTPALIEEAKFETNILSAKLKYHANQDCYSCVADADAPKSVAINNAPLTAADDLIKAESGYYYDSANRALHIKYRPSVRTFNIQVAW